MESTQNEYTKKTRKQNSTTIPQTVLPGCPLAAAPAQTLNRAFSIVSSPPPDPSVPAAVEEIFLLSGAKYITVLIRAPDLFQSRPEGSWEPERSRPTRAPRFFLLGEAG